MIKKAKYSYLGMNQDLTKSKHPGEFYYDANNITVVATDSQSTGSLSNTKGNLKVIELPIVCLDEANKKFTYGDQELKYSVNNITDQFNSNIGCDEDTVINTCSNKQIIIGQAVTRNSIILFSTDDNGYDCIWEVENILNNNHDLKLLYVRNLNFSSSNPIQALYNYENSIIQKLYWVDNKNQLRFLNIKHSIENGDLEDLIDLDPSNINTSGDFSLTQPTIPNITQGGQHTSGMIQYAYNLYRLNGSQTSLSPISKLVSLDNGDLGGGDINESVGSSPLININSLDLKYTHIKLYAIKYTSFNETPSINVIVDKEIDNYDLFTYLDNGTIINTITLSEFLFLGSNPFIPQHIASKDNRLFSFNIKDQPFDFEIDTRLYSFETNAESTLIWNNVTTTIVNDIPIPTPTNILNINSDYIAPEKHDCINPDFDLYKYQYNNDILGAEGKYFKLEFKQIDDNNIDFKNTRFLKDLEIYRYAIQFYNDLGQKSQPSWLCDYKTPSGNLENKYNVIKFELKDSFYQYINNTCFEKNKKPVGYRILRAERTVNDRTIIAQGGINSMIEQTTTRLNSGFGPACHPWVFIGNRVNESDNLVKIPNIITRPRGFKIGNINNLGHLELLSGECSDNDDQEIHGETDPSFQRQKSWQNTKIMQLNSPDVLFNDNISFTSGMYIRVKGIYSNPTVNTYHRGINVRNGSIYYNADISNQTNYSRGQGLSQYGFIGPGRDDEDDRTIYHNQKHHYFDFNSYNPSPSLNEYNIYGKPEIANRGVGIKAYNNDNRYRYSNNLFNFLSDRKKNSGRQKKNEEAITSINTTNIRNLTFILGNENNSTFERKGLENLWSEANDSINGFGLVLGEVCYHKNYYYLGNIYKGITYESKTRTNYLEIGDYKLLDENENLILNAGDTYVQKYKSSRLTKGDSPSIAPNVYQLTEVNDFIVETNINLLNRNDISLKSWNIQSHPSYLDSHNYNYVYSQESNLIQNLATSFKFKKVNSFDTRVIASKVKIPGEVIDNFTDYLENEILDLDGKYGSINGVANLKDEVFAIQDTGLAHIVINPRAQIQGSDGVSIELGKGSVLYDYNYLSTTSGTLNKWSVIETPTGFYYLDLLNKSVVKVEGNSVADVSNVLGMHTFFNNNLEYNNLVKDNPILKTGVSGGYDFINKSAYITVLQDKPFTINLNHNSRYFESFHDFKPSLYISKGENFFTSSPDNNKVYKHNEGEYQTFYDVKYPSTITLMINPESDLDCVFNNIEYKSELYLNDIDQPDKTLTHIQAYNEYQDSGRIELIYGRNGNIRRKFRNWHAQIPRNKDNRDRIRNPWVFLKLELDSESNYKMILHDVIIHYTT